MGGGSGVGGLLAAGVEYVADHPILSGAEFENLGRLMRERAEARAGDLARPLRRAAQRFPS